jgi:hypothetical protein
MPACASRIRKNATVFPRGLERSAAGTLPSVPFAGGSTGLAVISGACATSLTRGRRISRKTDGDLAPTKGRRSGVEGFG